MGNVLEVNKLTTKIATKYGEVVPISDISFTVDRGETVGLVGESGCGKSMTINSIMRLLPEKTVSYEVKSIRISGQDITELEEKDFCKIRGSKMSMIFQEPMTSLNPSLKIGFQIAEPLRLHTNCTKAKAIEKAKDALRAVGITDVERVMNSYPFNLSGGMKQRVVIAMAIICHPDILLADEPTTALDVTIQAQILRLIKDIQSKNDMGIVLVTHDLGVVAEECDRIIIMYCGQIVEQADTVTIFTKAAHPYTKGLIECIPRLTDQKDRLAHIEGNVMNIREFQKPGCRFAERCPFVTEKCRTETPLLQEVESGHLCRCWKTEK